MRRFAHIRPVTGSALALSLFVLPAKSASESCARIPDPKARLACYDKMASPSKREPALANRDVVRRDDVAGHVAKDKVCNLQSLYEAVSQAGVAKSEYETKEAYNSRAMERLRSAGVNVSNIFCSTLGGTAIYDAEQGGYPVQVLHPFMNAPDEITGDYVSQTAFGVKTKVTKLTARSWEADVYIENEALAKVEPKKASELSHNVTIGIISDLVPPFIAKHNNNTTPTLTEPTEKHSVMHTLFFAPRHVVLYNNTTYETLWSKRVVECDRRGRTSYRIETCEPDQVEIRQ